jgi:error-prone DNA polymerase
MRFAKEQGIPAQGRGSATSSIVSYTLGISRVEPIAHNLLFERFINPGRTTYPDVDIDFSSERREEVIQYIYRRYGPEHTGMVCNLVTYRARSAVREVGYALGFPRPLVDRVAKALETYDSVMVRRDLEADGGFAEFFRRTGEGLPAEASAAEAAEALGFVDGMGQLNTRMPLVGKVPPWRQPPEPDDPNAPRPFAWLREASAGQEAEGGPSRSGMWEEAPESPPSIRSGGLADDEGGPGDTPASVAWLRAGRGTGYQADRDRLLPPALVAGRELDPESGMPLPPPRAADRLGRPSRWDPPARETVPRRADQGAHAAHSSVARVEPEPPPQPRGGSTVGLSDWERWLEFCARIDGFPRHLSIHSGGMLVTAAPLIDIAPIERATMPNRVVVQFDKRDVETLKLIKLDLLGLGMLAAMDETLQLIEHDCAVCVDLDRLPEDIPEVFAMLQAADTVGVFQVESRAQMQTLPKSRPKNLDDLVVEVAIIRPGPIQGNAVHPFLRRKQGLEPVTYLHPSLEPVLVDSMGVILYQEQVMRIAIEVAGFSPAASDGFRRAMGTWRSSHEMEKLHRQFVEGCLRQPGMTDDVAEELFRQVSAFASFGFAKSHAAAFARTAYESSFLKLFYPAQFLTGLINAQPMGFYPVEVLVNDAKRHGVTILPVDINASTYKTTTEWAGQPGWALAGVAGDDGSHDDDPGEPLPEGSGVTGRPPPVRSPACINPSAAARERWIPDSATGWGVRLGLGLVKGIGEQHEELLDRELERGPYGSLAEVVERTELPEEALERLIRTGGLDSLGRPRRELLWQLREVAGASRGRVDGRAIRGSARAAGRRSAAAGRPMDLRLPATEAPPLPELTESERIGDAYAVIGLDARRQVVTLFRPALDRLGAVPNAALSEMRSGPIRIGGLVVTRQHPMTAKGTVFLALEDETGMVNVTLWPDTWARLRGVVRRHALLLVDGELQREGEVVNVVAHNVRALPEVAAAAGGPDQPAGVRQLGHAGMRRLG